MNWNEVLEGLLQGKCYQLPGWYKYYVYANENGIIGLKAPFTNDTEYPPRISEMKQNNWFEVDITTLKDKGIDYNILDFNEV